MTTGVPNGVYMYVYPRGYIYIYIPTKVDLTRAKDVFQIWTAPRCALPSPTGSDGMVPSVAAWRYLQRARYNPFSMGRNFVPGALTFDLDVQLVRARDQTRLPCEFGANLFSGSRDIYIHNLTHKQTKKSQTALKTEPYGYAVHCMW